MLFSQAVFLPFLLATFLLWLPWRATGRKAVLLLASLVFYASWDVRFPALLGATWLIVFIVPPAVQRASDEAAKRRIQTAGIAGLLLLLFFFKYFGFFVDSTRPLLRLAGLPTAPGALRIILPVGISFYVFQAISYLIDCRRGRLAPSRSWLDTALYVAFFPLLLAGPIEKGARWMSQLQRYQPLRFDNLRDGVERMLLGYVLKVGIADPLAPFCNDIFGRVATAGSGELWAGAFAYSLQIFTDFAGYSLIARGTAKLFGYEVIHNFEQPYFSRSFSEFWRRWHISLSTWIWDYVFNPLMSALLRRIARWDLLTVRQEMRIAYPVAAMTTMLLCGLWHGAGFTYLVWGGLHGLCLTGERLLVYRGRTIPMRARLRGAGDVARFLVGLASTQALVALAWLFFRAASLEQVRYFVTHIVHWQGSDLAGRFAVMILVYAAMLLTLDLLEYRTRSEVYLLRLRPAMTAAVCMALLVVVGLYMATTKPLPFVYFQF